MEHGHEQVLELQPGEEQVLWLEQLSTLHCTHGRASGLGERDMHTTPVADPGFSKWGGTVLSQMGGRTSCFQVKSA